MSAALIPVTVVTGFLGAGKSTLVQQWLQELPKDEVAVIVNERGDIGIDGELLGAHVARLREITGGCVCCSSQAELMSALLDLSESDSPPRRVLIETSGAASPAGVVRAIGAARAREQLQLDGVIAVVNIERTRETLAQELAVEQLGFADVVVLSHVDRAGSPSSPVDVNAVHDELQRYAPAALFAHARRGVIGSSLLELLARRSEVLQLPAQSSGHSAIEAVSLVLDGELDEALFCDWVESALADVGPRLLRLKGILAMADVAERVIVQGVGDTIEVQPGMPWADAARTSRLVVLGLGLDAEALEAGFLACAARGR